MNYERWYWILREYVGEDAWVDIYEANMVFHSVESEEERLGKAEERYEKMCIEQDEGQPNDNDSGWEQ